MSVEIRPPAEEELRAAMRAAEGAFGSELEDEDWERERVALPASRALAAFDGETPVGLAGAYAFDLTIPGGQLPCAGVTWVGVLPSHRRRGILRDFMRRQLDDVRDWGEPIAALWASESAIYGRFGYGLAAPGIGAKSDRARFALRDDAGPQGGVRLVDLETAYGLFPPVYELVRPGRAGMLTRSEHWWREHTLADPKSWRRGASQKFYAAVELDGAVIADIALERQHPAGVAALLGQRMLGAGDAAGRRSGHGDMVASRQQASRDREADAARAAGDERNRRHRIDRIHDPAAKLITMPP